MSVGNSHLRVSGFVRAIMPPVLATLTLLFVGTFIYWALGDAPNGSPILSSENLWVLISGAVAIVLGIISLNFLRPSSPNYRVEESTLGRQEVHLLRQAIAEMRVLAAGGNVGQLLNISDDERAKYLEKLVQLAAEQITGSAKAAFPEGRPEQRVDRYETASLKRLDQYADELGRRASFALWVGVVFALAGVATLGSSLIWGAPSSYSDLPSYLGHYSPRLSIALIVEFVAFFFLRTYARTLTDIRYIQNEITNIEMKLIGLHGAAAQSLPDISKKALLALIQTERNHVLEKGQSSLEMERERMEADAFVQGLNAAAGILKGNSASLPGDKEPD